MYERMKEKINKNIFVLVKFASGVLHELNKYLKENLKINDFLMFLIKQSNPFVPFIHIR